MEIKTFSEYCKETFGTKVYRLSLSSGCTCPNRDGRVGYGGCSFCSEKGSGEFCVTGEDIERQIEEAKKKVDDKFPKNIKKEDRKYIAYFQSFTNTYGETKKLEEIYEKALENRQIVALSIGTRPDCLEEDKLEMLERLNRKKPVWIELGLQTTKEECANKLNRCYSLNIFETSYYKLKEKGISVIVHVILGLPYEERKDTLKTIEYLANLEPKIDGIKLHLLHLLKGTKMEKEYEKQAFKILSIEEYITLVVDCLKRLPQEVVIHRLTGDGDKKSLIEPKWSGDKKRVLNSLNKAIKEAKRGEDSNLCS